MSEYGEQLVVALAALFAGAVWIAYDWINRKFPLKLRALFRRKAFTRKGLKKYIDGAQNGQHKKRA